MKKFISINIQYNVLSLCSVALGFIFIIILGRKLGASELTDSYFMSLVVISYLSHIIQGVWGAMNPYYVEKKLKDEKEASKIVCILLNNTIIISFVIVFLYFIITDNFRLLNPEVKTFLDTFIFYLILKNILIFNNNVLKLEHFFSSIYIVEILIQIINIITVIYILDMDIIVLAYSMLTGTALSIVWQFYLIFKKTYIQYSLFFYHKVNSTIYRNSIKLKLGTLLYGAKEVIIAVVFTGLGPGIFSLYSYANKFVNVIVRIVNTPILNVYLTKVSYAIAKNNLSEINHLLRKVLAQTATLFTVSAATLYIILPYLLDIFFANKFTPEDISGMTTIYSYLILLNFIVTIGHPFSGLLRLLKIFNYTLMVNFIFFILIILGYFLFKEYSLSYPLFLTFLIIAQGNNFLLHFIKYKLLI